MNSCLSWSLSFRQTSGLDYCVVHVLISSLKDQLLIKFSDLYIKRLGSMPDQQILDLEIKFYSNSHVKLLSCCDTCRNVFGI